MKKIRFIFDAFLILILTSAVILIITGIPHGFRLAGVKIKNLRPFAQLFIGIFLLKNLVLTPGTLLSRLQQIKNRFTAFLSQPSLVHWIFAGGSALFIWQQIKEYLSLEINFLPFSFYDYMLYYFSHSHLNYTGLLHTYYHVNWCLYFLAPLWMIFKSPWLLIISYGILAAAAVYPLYHFAKKLLGSSALAIVVILTYLNYRFLQNVLQMNFSIEILYPFFIFCGTYFAFKQKWMGYYSSLFLGLFVKEDSFFYLSAIGLILISGCLWKKEDRFKGRLHGVASIALSFMYVLFLVFFLAPWTGSDIMMRSTANYSSSGRFADAMMPLLKQPWMILGLYFNHPEKIRTFVKIVSQLAFVPLCSPMIFLLFIPLFPLFLHHTGDDANFYQLNFHYAAAVLPFIFIAFIYGLKQIRKITPTSLRSWLTALISLIILFANAGQYRTEPVTQEHLQSIKIARSIPPGTNVVTHGHLLPYLGYRKMNYYFAQPFELPIHRAHHAYDNADYYLIDHFVNPYPLSYEKIEQKRLQLIQDPRYELLYSDSNRFLFKRKTEAS